VNGTSTLTQTASSKARSASTIRTMVVFIWRSFYWDPLTAGKVPEPGLPLCGV
jgi:hypothetical protein